MAEPPDYVGIGTQSAGHRWWHDLLLAHPQVHAPPRTDLHFFDDFCARPMTDEDAATYRAHFARPPGTLCGEWTPRYMFDPWTPELLHRVAPDAKLLVLVRDPVERYRAGLAHQVGRSPRAKEQLLVLDGIERGRYATQLRRVLAVFAPEQLLVQQYERCLRDPAGEHARLLAFLGLDAVAAPAELALAPPEPGTVPLWPDLLADLHDTYGPEIEALAELVPDLDLDLWPTAEACARR
jgi:hypothetical protein